jgi:hypothetical protein
MIPSVRPSVLLAACCCLLLAPAGAMLDYSRVHLVDHDPHTGNLLFRGNMPANGTHVFAIDLLLQYLRQRAHEASIDFPVAGNFTLTDISLNNDFDGKDFKAERDFWADSASKRLGNFVNWPLGLAGIVGPGHYPRSKVGPMSNGSVWKVDKIPSHVAQIRAWLLAKQDKPVVQYVHCTAGCDRTGEVIGAYRMRYQPANGFEGTPVIPMYALDTKECGRSPNYWSTMALEWFCEYIKYNDVGAGAAHIGDCEGFATCKFAKKCQPTHNTSGFLA